MVGPVGVMIDNGGSNNDRKASFLVYVRMPTCEEGMSLCWSFTQEVPWACSFPSSIALYISSFPTFLGMKRDNIVHEEKRHWVGLFLPKFEDPAEDPVVGVFSH